MALLVNFIGFQVGWFACVLGAANDKELLGMIIALGVIIYHVVTQGDLRKELKLILVALAIGLLWETWVLNLDILRYPSHPESLFWAPSWLVMMWALFATTINLSMGWLKGRWALSVLMGAVFGPLAFIGGEKLGAVVFLDSTLSIITLSVGWGLLMPLLLWTAERINQNFNSQENVR
ncbi:DUF2878 domain-containing protein [Porticoccaceae bacterium]|jgi:hypothetical protein|nr:DUF2878 domain-containing protein [Porticoccaceae bacterium]